MSPKLSYTYSKGFGPGYYVRVSGAGFQHPTDVLSHCILKKPLCDCTELSFCRFVAVELQRFGKNILHDPTVFPELLYIPCEYFATVQYCTYLLLSTTWYCISDKGHTYSNTANPFSPVQYCDRLNQLHSHWPCIEYLCIVYLHYLVTVHQ